MSKARTIKNNHAMGVRCKVNETAGFEIFYLCALSMSCNFLTDREVRTMVTTGARPPSTPGQVYKCLGCRPKCGRCARSISLIMDEALGCSRFIYPSAPSNGDDTADWLSSRLESRQLRS